MVRAWIAISFRFLSPIGERIDSQIDGIEESACPLEMLEKRMVIKKKEER